MQATCPRRRELDEVGERPRAALLGEPDQDDEDLRRCAGVGKRPVARLGRDAEEVREGCEPDLPRALPEQSPREPDGVDDRRGDATPRQELHLPVEEGEVEAGVVRDDRRVPGEREQAADGQLGAWRSRERLRADPRDGRDGGG